MIKQILFISFLFLLVFIAVWKQVSVWSPAPVKGVYESPAMPHLTLASFMDGSFQDQYEKFTEDMKGMKGIFTRIRNQCDYTLFGIPHAERIVRGKQGYLFSEKNIEAVMGRNFAGEEYIRTKVKELAAFQKLLWTQEGILLVVIFAPDKASFYPELIPDRLKKNVQGITNYDLYRQYCIEAGVNLIDFNHYFIGMKDTVQYRLFSKTGVHWSTYGAYLAADSLVRYLEKKLGRTLNAPILDGITQSRFPRDEDDDIGQALNLFFTIPQAGLAYPSYHFGDQPGTCKPPALFIGDSYYWNWQRPGIIRKIFSNEDFWYYDKDIFPVRPGGASSTWQVDLKEQICRQDVIIILQSANGEEINTGFGFIDRSLPEFDTSATNTIRHYEKVLTASRENMAGYRTRSAELNIPFSRVIRTEAVYAPEKDLRRKSKSQMSKIR
jgi:hypothetical protein